MFHSLAHNFIATSLPASFRLAFSIKLPSTMDLSPRDDEGGYKLYHYNPTIPGAVVIAIAFGLTTGYHVWQLMCTRCWMASPIVIGGFCKSSTGMDATLEHTADQLEPVQIIGYAARAVSGQQSPDWTLGPYIIQAIFLLVAPALYAATIYMEFGRIVTLVDGKQHTLIRHQWITKIFVAGDVLSFLLQGGGMLTRLISAKRTEHY
jgi:hypothetical protein